MTRLTAKNRSDLNATQFAFPNQRKVPLENAKHVRNAIARFNQVDGVTDSERDSAWKRIQSAARKHDVEVQEFSWHQLKSTPSKANRKS